MEEANIPFVILKENEAAVYYNNPEFRKPLLKITIESLYIARD